MNYRKLLLSALAATLAAACLAQDGPPPGGQGGPPRGGFGGPGFGPGGGLQRPEMIVMRRDVQDELQLTDDQKTKLQDLRETMRPQGGPGGPGGPGGGPPPDGPPPGGGGPSGPGGPGGPGGGDPEAMRKNMEAMRKKMTEEIQKILTADQFTRLKEVSIQLSGNAAVTDPQIQKDLALTEAQKATIKDLVKKQSDANRSVFEKMRNGEIDREDMPAIMQKNRRALNDLIGGILSDDQKVKLKAMGGKPFVASQDERGVGGLN